MNRLTSLNLTQFGNLARLFPGVALVLLASPAFASDGPPPMEKSYPPQNWISSRPVIPDDALYSRHATILTTSTAIQQNGLTPSVSGGTLITLVGADLVGVGGEPSIAVNPANPNQIAITSFAGTGAGTAPLYYSTDGGITWTQYFSISQPPGTSGIPCDQTLDYGRAGVLYGTFLTCGKTTLNIATGGTTDPTKLASWSWPLDGAGNTIFSSFNGTLNQEDQPWILVNRDPTTPGQDDVYGAYDDPNPFPGSAHVSVALVATPGTLPLNFTRDNVVGGENGPGNAGLRLAVDPNSGAVYAAWQQPSAPFTNPDGSIHQSYRLNRSTDGGQTWTLNGSGTGIEVAQRSSDQGSFAGVNSILGGIDHAAVDPTTGDVYYVFGHRDGGTAPQPNRLGCIRLHDNGSGTLLLDPEHYVGTTGSGNITAVLPSVAVAANGVVGVLYDSLDGTNASGLPIFSAHIAKSSDKGVTWTDEVLLTFLSTTVPTSGARILGDYQQMKSVGRFFYGVFTGNSAALGASGAATMGPIFFKSFAGGPLMTIAGDVTFADTCVGATNFATLNVCNTGTEDLQVGPITSSNPQFAVVNPSSGYPVTVSPNFCFPFRVRFSPTSTGAKQATFTLLSNDSVSATNKVNAFGNGVGTTIISVIVDNGSFGDVCLGTYKDLNLTINNAGGCTLYISNITSTLPGQFLVPTVVNYPVVLQPGDSIALPIRFQPTGAFGPRAGSIIVASNDPLSPNRMVSVTGNVPSGKVAVTGSTAFGDVCSGTVPEKTISVCNVGKCDLHVLSAALSAGCTDFTLVNNPFPATVSPDFCLQLVVRFTPTSCGAKSCTLVITTDDPVTPTVTLTVTANTPCAALDVPPDLGFAPEVITNIGPCSEPLPFPISNKGNCNLTITAITIGGANPGDYHLVGLPSFPIILQPGDIVGAGDLQVAFAPAVVARSRTATISVTYVSDPISGATTTVTRNLCGEGVLTGARVLVMAGGVPLPVVDKIQLQRLTVNRSGDVVQQPPLVTVIEPAPCGSFQYHREYGTVSNPVQLLAGDYQLTVTATINGKHKTLQASFSLNTCDFNPTVVINF